MTHLPSSAQFNVSFGLAGGPAGSYAASVLAREGISVTVLERDKFPRYHVGESLIPSVRHYMRFIEADHKLAGHGFVHKVRMAAVTWLVLDLTPLSSRAQRLNSVKSAFNFGVQLIDLKTKDQYKREGCM
jgi:2-polyprenyl-6-methoxyphenol hydroxylase-like FAD-dependent oxidoreductase